MKFNDTIHVNSKNDKDIVSSVKKKKELSLRYKYISFNPLILVMNFILYRVIARPVAYFYMKLRFHYKVYGKEKLKECKDSGYFLYSNHTLIVGDAFGPNVLFFKKRNYIITGEQANSLKLIMPVLRGVGSIPVTSNATNFKNVYKAVEYRIKKNKSTVTIFPEVHAWPYYTGIRDVNISTFYYPAKMKAPIFVTTQCYKKRKFIKRPKIECHIEGPFYPSDNNSTRENALYFKECFLDSSKKNSEKFSSYSYFNYVID